MNIYWDEKAWLEYLYWQTRDKITKKNNKKPFGGASEGFFVL